ncbi:MAG: hypothetical protein KDE06_09030 [Rhodobacteraceae bacterium]|nr:hypothetical protein [Paracoccaceae bacterium]MCB2151281.1 hypothetical protein [Paracoccaceae bacterium]MCB2158320.1 hypothetical protein [Paracoccaceae bacterium]HRX73686.1 C45 family autoproteolytic acyltransferase/hydrolase [Hyphomonas sp.]
MHLTFRSLSEERPSDALRRVFANGWPGWSQWMRERQKGDTPRLRDARRAMRRHMPELESLWDNWTDVCGGGDDAALFLSFWSPPRYLVHCSQAVMVDNDGPLLIRNYDLDPKLNESTIYSTRWRSRRVAGMVEGIVGLADGMNDAGLAASLTFGGRVVHGPGFGIPLIMRYVLEMCSDMKQAVEALRAVPSHMAYNVTVADRSGEWATVYLSPDRPPILSQRPYATNHQLGVEWPRHGRMSNTLGRARHLEQLLRVSSLSADRMTREFLSEPLFSTGYARGFGTVYTASYRPAMGKLELFWKDGTRLDWSLDDVDERQVQIAYSARGSRGAPQPEYSDGRQTLVSGTQRHQRHGRIALPPAEAADWRQFVKSTLDLVAKGAYGSEFARLAQFWCPARKPRNVD